MASTSASRAIVLAQALLWASCTGAGADRTLGADPASDSDTSGDGVDAKQDPRTNMNAGADAAAVPPMDSGAGAGPEGRPAVDAGADEAPGRMDAAAGDVDPASFSAIRAGGSDTVSTPAGKWGFGTATCSAGHPGNNTLLEGKQAGTKSLCFVQLVASKSTGQVYVQEGTGLWWRWNGVDQWTPEVTGDPRSPTPAPTLGPNKLSNPSFATGTIKDWYVGGANDGPCTAPGCGYAIQKTSPKPGGNSLHVMVNAANAWKTSFGTFWGGTPGKTYLLSAWSTGSAGAMHAEHDLGTPSRTVDILPSAGWVQTLCKVVPVKPDPGSMMVKFYLPSALNVTDAYIGQVDPGYPAPVCRNQ